MKEARISGERENKKEHSTKDKRRDLISQKGD